MPVTLRAAVPKVIAALAATLGALADEAHVVVAGTAADWDTEGQLVRIGKQVEHGRTGLVGNHSPWTLPHPGH